MCLHSHKGMGKMRTTLRPDKSQVSRILISSIIIRTVHKNHVHLWLKTTYIKTGT